MENPISLSVVKGTTSKRLAIFIGDSSVTTGAGLTGLVFNTASLTAYYFRDGDTAATVITLANATVGTWVSGGFKQIDATNLPGAYELDIPDACLATGANYCTIMLKGAASMRNTQVNVELTATNQQDAVRGGMTALPNAAAAAAGGLWILGSNNTAAVTIGALTTGALSTGAISTSGTVTFNAFTVTNNTNLSGNFTIAGTTLLAGSVAFGATTFASFDVTAGFGVGGDFIVQGDLGAQGSIFAAQDFTITGNWSVAGTTTLALVNANNASNNIQGVRLGGTQVFNASGTWTVSIVGNVTGNLSGSVGSIGTGGITASTFAADAINAAALATDAVTEIAVPVLAKLPAALVSGRMDSTVGAYQNAGVTPLQPTTAGRTLDVTSTGAAGIDWGNVENQSTSVNLSNTTVHQVDNVTTVINNPNAGNGAFLITVTVTDGTNPLSQATVRVTAGILTFSTVTDANGEGLFSLDGGNYDVSVTKGGYEFTPSGRTVTGNQAGTILNPLVMTAVVIPVAPSDPLLCRIYGYARSTRTLLMLPNAEVIATLNHSGPAYAGGFLVGRERRTVTNANGLFQLDVPQNDQITPTGTKWSIRCKDANIHYEAAFNDSVFNLNSVLP